MILENELNIGFILILFIFSITLFFILYFKRENIKEFQKKVLFSIRVIVVLLLMFLLLKPSYNKISKKRIKKDFLLLLDVSNSMDIKDSKKNSGLKFIKTNLSSIQNILNNKFNLTTKIFTDKLSDLEFNKNKDIKISLNRNFTAIGDIFSEVKNSITLNRMSGILLLSDGNSNKGAQIDIPIKNINVPIYVIPCGITERKKDISIDKVEYNPVLVRNSLSTITVNISQKGYNNKNVEIFLNDNNSVLDRKVISFNNNKDYKISFNIKFDKIGEKKLSIKIPTLKGEFLNSNNSKQFFVNIIKDKIDVLFLTETPNFDFKFLKNSFLLKKNINLDIYIKLKNKYLYSKQSFDRKDFKILDRKDFDFNLKKILKYDVFVLYNAFKDEKFKAITENIKIAVENSSKGLFVIGTDGIYNSSSSLKKMIPVKLEYNKIVDSNTQLKIDEQALYHSIFSIFHSNDIAKTVLNNLPIFSGYIFIKRAKPSATVFFRSKFSKDNIILNKDYDNSIIMASMKYGNGKVIYLNGIDIYKIPFYLKETDNQLVFENILYNSLFWLSTLKNRDNVDIFINKHIFNISEKFSCKILVLDDNYNKLPNCKIKVELFDKTGKFLDKYDSYSDGNNNYYVDFINRYVGNINVKFTIYYKDKLYKVIKRNIIVNNSSLENSEYIIDYNTLNKIASLSNGKIISNIKDIEKIPSKIETKIVKNLELLWLNRNILIIILLLMFFEWYYRKRIGLD